MKGISSLLGKSAGTGLLGVLLSVSSFPVPVQAEPGDGPHNVVEITGGVRAVGRLIIAGDANVGRAIVVAPGSVLHAGTVLTAGSTLNGAIDHLLVLTDDTPSSTPRCLRWGARSRRTLR